ncbi:MAG: hypothetical protein ACRELE_12210 [Gemmatimonadales bacterium]
MGNEDRYWFPAKRYGWGWVLPNCWQGWVVFLGWLGALISAVLFFAHPPSVAFWAVLSVMLVLLIAI